MSYIPNLNKHIEAFFHSPNMVKFRNVDKQMYVCTNDNSQIIV